MNIAMRRRNFTPHTSLTSMSGLSDCHKLIHNNVHAHYCGMHGPYKTVQHTPCMHEHGRERCTLPRDIVNRAEWWGNRGKSAHITSQTACGVTRPRLNVAMSTPSVKQCDDCVLRKERSVLRGRSHGDHLVPHRTLSLESCAVV